MHSAFAGDLVLLISLLGLAGFSEERVKQMASGLAEMDDRRGAYTK